MRCRAARNCPFVAWKLSRFCIYSAIRAESRLNTKLKCNYNFNCVICFNNSSASENGEDSGGDKSGGIRFQRAFNLSTSAIKINRRESIKLSRPAKNGIINFACSAHRRRAPRRLCRRVRSAAAFSAGADGLHKTFWYLPMAKLRSTAHKHLAYIYFKFMAVLTRSYLCARSLALLSSTCTIAPSFCCAALPPAPDLGYFDTARNRDGSWAELNRAGEKEK